MPQYTSKPKIIAPDIIQYEGKEYKLASVPVPGTVEIVTRVPQGTELRERISKKLSSLGLSITQIEAISVILARFISNLLATERQRADFNTWKVRECVDFLNNQHGLNDDVRFKYVCSVLHAQKIVKREAILEFLSPKEGK